MPQPNFPLPADRPRPEGAITRVPPSTLRPAPSTGAIRVLQNRRAPAQLSLFQRVLPVR